MHFNQIFKHETNRHNICAPSVVMTTNKTNFLCARTCKSCLKMTEISFVMLQQKTEAESVVRIQKWSSTFPSARAHHLHIRPIFKSRVTVSFDSQEFLHKEFVIHGLTVSQQICRGVPRHLTQHTGRKCPEKWHTQNWIIQLNNKLAHTDLSVL
jgi:hypothetical protein